jgi:hypothetical protein
MKILSIVLISFLIGCSTLTVEEKPVSSPIPVFGCQKYKGKEWESCVIKLMGKLEKILNEKPERTIINTERYDSKYVDYTTQYCLGDKDICFDVIERKYEPTVMGLVIDAVIKVGIGFGLGFASGVTVVN